MTLTAYYQLRNTKAAGLGFELLTSEPGAFIVLEESSYEKPYEIARYGHNGSAGDRSNAFSCAMNKARSLQITVEQSWITTFTKKLPESSCNSCV